MYSLNVPVPSGVARLASDLARELPGARARPRGEHTLVCKRLDPGSGPDAVHRLDARLREALAGAPPFAARVSGIEQFREAVTGPSPVVYLAVESPGLLELHDRLVDEFGAIEGLEGEDYTPHVTLARDGDMASAERAAAYDVEPVSWTVTELEFFDSKYREVAGRVSLPA